MKKRSTLVIGILVLVLAMLTGTLAFAESGNATESFSKNTTSTAGLPQPEYVRGGGTYSMTHSTSQTIVPGTVRCATTATGIPTENSFWREFVLADFGVVTTIDVASVDVGIETSTLLAATETPMIVRLYTLVGDLDAGGALTLIATENVVVADQALTLLNVPLSAPVTLFPTDVLVMEVHTPNGNPDQFALTLGSNAAPETDASYISAAGCGISSPTPFSGIGFPNVHLVYNVWYDVNQPTDVSLTGFDAANPASSPMLPLGIAAVALILVGVFVTRVNRREDAV